MRSFLLPTAKMYCLVEPLIFRMCSSGSAYGRVKRKAMTNILKQLDVSSLCKFVSYQPVLFHFSFQRAKSRNEVQCVLCFRTPCFGWVTSCSLVLSNLLSSLWCSIFLCYFRVSNWAPQQSHKSANMIEGRLEVKFRQYGERKSRAGKRQRRERLEERRVEEKE